MIFLQFKYHKNHTYPKAIELWYLFIKVILVSVSWYLTNLTVTGLTKNSFTFIIKIKFLYIHLNISANIIPFFFILTFTVTPMLRFIQRFIKLNNIKPLILMRFRGLHPLDLYQGYAQNLLRAFTDIISPSLFGR